MHQQSDNSETDFSSAIMHGHEEDRVYAKFHSRYLAMAIDGFVLALAMGLLENSGLELPTIIYSLISISYYVFLPTRMDGQTLGKKLLGIQIISTSDEVLSFKQMFLREVPLKLLSLLLLGYGYLRALFVKDAITLHDALAKTRVVRVNAPGVVTGFSWKRSLAISGVSLASICFCVYFVVFRSSFLANKISEQMSLAGVEVQNLTGNLSSGFEAELIRSATADHEVEFIHPRIHLDTNLLKLFSGHLRIREISVESGKLLVAKKMPNLNSDKEPQDQTPPQNNDPSSSDKLTTAGPSKKKNGILEIDLFSIQNLEFGFMGSSERFLLNQFSFTGLRLEPKIQSWSGFNLKSKYADLYIPEGKLVDGSLDLKQKIQGLIKKEGFPQYVINNLDVNLKIAGTSKNPHFELDAARETVKFSFINGKTQGSFNSFHPHHYFAGMPPIYEFKGKLEPGLFPFMPNFIGTAKIREKLFHFKGPLLKMRGQHRTYRDQFAITLSPMELFSGKGSKLEIETPRAKTTHDALSRLYFNRSFAQLPAEYQKTIQMDTRHFKIKQTQPSSDMILDLLKASLDKQQDPLLKLKRRQKQEAKKHRIPASKR